MWAATKHEFVVQRASYQQDVVAQTSRALSSMTLVMKTQQEFQWAFLNVLAQKGLSNSLKADAILLAQYLKSVTVEVENLEASVESLDKRLQQSKQVVV